jgi:phosphoserine phosphatase
MFESEQHLRNGKKAITGILMAVTLLALAACVVPTPAPARTLDAGLAWYGDNRQRLDEMIAAHGTASASYDPAKKPVATFDWDNSVIKNDIGAATVYWLIRHEKVLQPPAADWRVIPFLTAQAAETLRTVCGTETPPGSPLPTATNRACADELVSLNEHKALTNGQAAFAGYNYRTYDPTSAWQSQILAGYTPDEVRAFAGQVIDANLAAPLGATQTVGSTEVDGYIRIYDQVKDLIGTLQANGFAVWVVSASPQYIVEPFAARVGIAADHVVGVRLLLDDAGRLTHDFAGCGPVADKENTIFTYVLGKRCWINKVIYGDDTANALALRPADSRPLLAVGDSDTDAVFVQDATALKLVINRNANELMCNAYENLESQWLINPMFIKPKAAKADPYLCSTTACRDEAGTPVPCRDAAGEIIPDQIDSV